MKLFVQASIGAILLGGCATMDEQPSEGEPARPDTGICDAAAVQSYVGRQVTDELGAKILAESGARSLRWGPPNSAWTMDYREDRVNVRYDEQMVITSIGCG